VLTVSAGLSFRSARRVPRLVTLVERQQEKPDEGEEPTAVRQSNGFSCCQLELLQKGLDVERLVHPAGHVFGDLRHLKGPITDARVLEIVDAHLEGLCHACR
jgi:hypothetical protein